MNYDRIGGKNDNTVKKIVVITCELFQERKKENF